MNIYELYKLTYIKWRFMNGNNCELPREMKLNPAFPLTDRSICDAIFPKRLSAIFQCERGSLMSSRVREGNRILARDLFIISENYLCRRQFRSIPYDVQHHR